MDAANRAISSPLLEGASVEGARGVIINVTGGPDLSLLEVSEASTIIQEAAHEDANIIFGAVVDPQLAGKVKITVIATGFDRKTTGRGVPEAASRTPVDLTNYTQHLNRPAESPVAPAAPMKARTSMATEVSVPSPALDHGSVAPPLTVSRRPGIEMSVPSVGPGATVSVSAMDNDLQTPFDVPAFLRRPH